jgi:hypothetical protein
MRIIHGRLCVLAMVLVCGLWYYFMNYAMMCAWRSPYSVHVAVVADPQMEGDARVHREGWYGTANNRINDLYFRNVFANLGLHLDPHHTIVLGDIFSHWQLPDEEFFDRVARYNGNIQGLRNILNLTGNHDIGYGAYIKRSTLDRFVATFGPRNSLVSLRSGDQHGPDAYVAVLDSMPLDGCVLKDVEDGSWAFVEEVKRVRDENPTAIILLATHIPLHKPKGSCPGDDPETRMVAGGTLVAQQNMLSPETSAKLLTRIRPDLVLTGHDHEGCEYIHSFGSAGGAVQEITLRSVMGDYGGCALLLDVHNKNSVPAGGSLVEWKRCDFVPIWVVLSALGLTFGVIVAVTSLLLIGLATPAHRGKRVKAT